MRLSDPIKQLRLALTAMVALVALGTWGYYVLENWPPIDSLYMTVITLSTVGFKEVHPIEDVPGKVFTMVLLIFGVSIVFWAGASLVESVVGEQIWNALQRERMQKHISRLRGHFIVCGFGRMGQQIVRDLQREGVGHVVIERNPEQLPGLIAEDIPFIEGNASDDKILKQAGIERAKGLITVAPTDEDNVFITLSARALNPKLFVVARSIQVDNEDKLKMAGADRVMSPYVMGGKRMSTAVLRPNVLDFLELAVQPGDLPIVIEEITVSEESELVGKTLEASGLRTDTGLTVVAIKKASARVIANPGPEEVLAEGDVLIVLGMLEQLDKAQQIASPGSVLDLSD